MNVKIEPSWGEKLKGEFEKEYFAELTEFVKKEYKEGTVYPTPKNIFRAFDLCPFEKAKVIECMKFENVLGSVIAHLGAVSQFFSTIPVSAFLASLILALFFTAFLGFREGNCFRPGLIYFLGRDGKPLIVSAQTLFSEWLSLHENRPSFSIKR